MSETGFGRRAFLGTAVVGSAVCAWPAQAQTDDMPLTKALELRRSTRAFQPERGVDDETLLALAWAGQGINRPETGLRTAPSWHGATETKLYVADASGVRLYDPAANSLLSVLPTDIRPIISPQPFVATAPVCLIYAADLAGMPTDAPDEEKRTFATVDAAIVAQNVYLFCASRGLGTCLVGGVDAAKVQETLTMGARVIATFAQPVGWPA